MKRKIVAVLMCATMVTMLGVGCGSKESEDSSGSSSETKKELSEDDIKGSLDGVTLKVGTSGLFGPFSYYDEDGIYHEEKVPTVDGDYARVYDGIYDSIVNGKEQVIQPWQTILQMEMLETGVKDLK